MSMPYRKAESNDGTSFILPVNVTLWRLMRRLSKIPGFRLVLRHDVPQFDDYYCLFSIGSDAFSITTPLSDFIIEPVESGYPSEHFACIQAVLDIAEPWWSPWRLIDRLILWRWRQRS
jgi:hypothetical protein